VAVTPVGGGDVVVTVKGKTGTRGHGLLAYGQVHRPVHQSAAEKIVHALLEFADLPHRAEHLARLCGVARYFSHFPSSGETVSWGREAVVITGL
jgi:hypothetical protein